jgi:hypothetical protein
LAEVVVEVVTGVVVSAVLPVFRSRGQKADGCDAQREPDELEFGHCPTANGRCGV